MNIMTATAQSCAEHAWAPAWERAVAYGDGVFETILVHKGVMPLWAFHIARLQHACLRLQLHADFTKIEQACFVLAAQKQNGVLKLVLARSGGSRGYDARNAQEAVARVQYFPLPAYPLSRLQHGVRLHVCRHTVAQNTALAGLKHLNRLDSVLAASEWNRAWAEEGLLLDNTGAVIEGTVSNVFIVQEGVLQTPLLQHAGVAGVMRAYIAQTVAPALGMPVVEKRLTIADVLRADECFVCNSIFGVWPVRSIGVSALPEVAPVTHAIVQQIQALGCGDSYV